MYAIRTPDRQQLICKRHTTRQIVRAWGDALRNRGSLLAADDKFGCALLQAAEHGRVCHCRRRATRRPINDSIGRSSEAVCPIAFFAPDIVPVADTSGRMCGATRSRRAFGKGPGRNLSERIRSRPSHRRSADSGQNTSCLPRSCRRTSAAKKWKYLSESRIRRSV